MQSLCVCVCVRDGTLDSRVHGTSFDLPLQCAAVIGCDTILSALPEGYNRNLTIMALVMNMSRRLQTKAPDLDNAPLYACLYTDEWDKCCKAKFVFCKGNLQCLQRIIKCHCLDEDRNITEETFSVHSLFIFIIMFARFIASQICGWVIISDFKTTETLLWTWHTNRLIP